MKTLLLTPGTGNFHCGSCLRDEALVRALRRLGHDATIHALYLPLVLDHRGDDIDGDDVQMGGINMYLQARSAVFRHAPAFVERLLSRPGVLRRAADRSDMTSPAELGRMTEQMLLGGHGKTRHGIDRLVEHLRDEGHPDVVLLNNALLLGLAEPIADALGCRVACTLQGEDTFIDDLPEPWRANVWRLLTEIAPRIDAFLPVSEYHGRLMAGRLSLPAEKVRVVYNGIDTDRFAARAAPPEPPVIGYLARLCACKGLATLVDAFILIHQRKLLPEARLHLVGAAKPGDLKFAEAQRRRLEQAGLGDRVRIDTNVSFDEKLKALHGMSVLSVPATYGESFGLYLLEANAVGVPFVQPRHAAFPEVLAQTGGGILCEPGDAGALAEALAGLLGDEPRRRGLGEAGRAAVHDKFTADRMAQSVARVLEPICQATTP